MNKLIQGGIYTTSKTEFTYFVFCSENSVNELTFFKETSGYESSIAIKKYLDISITNTSDFYFKDHIFKIDKDQFKEICNGFIGVVSEEAKICLDCW